MAITTSMLRIMLVTLMVGPLMLSGCSGMRSTQDARSTDAASDELGGNAAATPGGEPAYVTVQHCLIAFRGTGTNATRTREEAEALAQDLFEQAKAGADFDEMVKQHTDDSPPGIYHMANHGAQADMTAPEPIFARGSMVAAFGDTGFPLEVGEFGLAPFDPQSSPFGWHIVKRIK